MLPSPTRLFEQLLRLLWPPSGRHRQSPTTAPPPTPAPCSYSSPEFRRHPHTSLLRGEDNTLIRPYLAAHNAHAMQVTA